MIVASPNDATRRQAGAGAETRGVALAAQLLETNLTVIEFITACPSMYWDVIPPGEVRTIGSIAFHIGRSYEDQIGGLTALLHEEPLPELFDDLDGHNARMAEIDFGRPKDEAIDLIQANGEAMARFVTSLSDEQLEQPAPVGPNLTIRHIVESAVFAHPNHHLDEMRDFLQRLMQEPATG